MSKVERLVGLPTKLKALGFTPPAYRAIREKAVDGLIPAFQINHIWHFDDAKTEEIAEALGLERAEPHQHLAA